MSRLAQCVVAAGLVILAGARQAGAQDPDPIDRLLGKTVTAVRMQIEDRPVDSEALLSLITIKPGETLQFESLRRTRDRLASDPRFERVSILGTDVPGGVELTFRLIPRHPVDDIAFQGTTGMDANELERLVREQYGGLPTNVRTSDLEESVSRLLQGEGFRTPKVSATVVETHNPDRATLVFLVDAGPRTMIRSVTIDGTSPLSKAAIESRTGAVAGAPFRERAIATGLVGIRDMLRGRKYYAAIATYTPPPVGGTEVDLVLRVDAGPLVEIQIEPSDHMPGGPRSNYIPIEREGSIDSDLLDDARSAIQTALRNEGYWKAEVQRTQSDPDAGRRIITFTIDRGKRYRVASVELAPGLRLNAETVARTEGLKVGQWFSEARARQALIGLVDLAYVQQGYHRVQLAPEFIGTPGLNDTEGGVIVRPVITEGPRATIAEIVFDLGEKPIVSEAELKTVMTIRTGTPYVRARAEVDREAMLSHYGSRGFQPEDYHVDAFFNATATEVTVKVTVREGPQLLVGEITVVGNESISRETILEEISLQRGQPYSDDKRLESQRRLSTLGFQSIRIQPEPRLPGEATVRVTISVQELPKTTIGGGGGVEVGQRAREDEDGTIQDTLDINPRAFFEIGRRNLGGRNRDLNFFSRVSLKPSTARGVPGDEVDSYGFIEYRVSATYRERYAFRSNVDLLFGATSEQAVRPTYSYLRRLLNADLLYELTPRATVSGRYVLEFNRLFDQLPAESQSFPLDRYFPQLRLSILSSGILWNRRDDLLAPTEGFQLGATGEMALEEIGSQAGYVKGFVQGSYFYPIRRTAERSLVLATRAQLGAARGFERARRRIGDNGEEITEFVKDVPASQRFYAGGSSTVRGFQLDRLGVPEILTVDGISNGGNAQIVLNGELRAIVGKLFNRNLTVVGFVDGGQVFREAGDLDLARLRGTGGFGFRYDSPLGPVRLDFGFKMNRIVYANRRPERGWEYHLSIGEAF